MEESIRTAIEALDHPDEQARREALQWLQEAGLQGMTALLDAALSEDYAISSAAARALAGLDHPARFDFMAQMVCARNPFAAELAVKALEGYGERAVEALAASLAHCHDLVKLTVVGALERIGSRRAVPPLMELLTTTHFPSLRYTAIQALGIIGDPTAVELIESFARDPDHHVRTRVRIALQRLASDQRK